MARGETASRACRTGSNRRKADREGPMTAKTVATAAGSPRSPQVTTPQSHLDQRCIDTIRTLAMDAVQKANSGHPGTPMALAPVAYTLWQRFLKYDPTDPIWPNRDHFVLSNGHASMLLYSLLYLTGVRAVGNDYKA